MKITRVTRTGKRGRPQAAPLLHYWSAYGDELKHHYDGDAGYDLHCYPPVGTLTVLPQTVAYVSTGMFVAPPPGYWIMITSRSSTIGKGLIVIPGIIDNGWRGELLVTCFNVSSSSVTIKAHDRIAQMIPMALHPIEAVRVDAYSTLPPGSRGTNGFGSTGSSK